MKKVLLLACVILSGCASVNNEQKMDCDAAIQVRTFGTHKAERVKIIGKRYDKFGQEWVHLQNKPGNARFIRTWQKADIFTDYICKE